MTSLVPPGPLPASAFTAETPTAEVCVCVCVCVCVLPTRARLFVTRARDNCVEKKKGGVKAQWKMREEGGGEERMKVWL